MEFSVFKELPILGILRGIKEEIMAPLVNTIISSGLIAIEITMNTDNAAYLIKSLNSLANDKLLIGAGTVLTMKDLEEALNAGAKFVVMPTIVDDIMKYCVKNNIPVFPGALTPNEIFNAWNRGATMVKVFPSSFFGPKYFKEVKAPLNQVELLACGGVNSNNIADFFNMGASAVAFGASIFKNEWLVNKKFDLIELQIKKIIDAYYKWNVKS